MFDAVRDDATFRAAGGEREERLRFRVEKNAVDAPKARVFRGDVDFPKRGATDERLVSQRFERRRKTERR